MKVFLLLNWQAAAYPWWMDKAAKSLLDQSLAEYKGSKLIENIFSFGAVPPKLLLEYGVENLGDGTGGLTSLFQQLTGRLTAEDRLIFSWWDYPLVKEERIEKILELHSSQRVEFTNSDGYPLGLFPEVIQGSILASLQQMAAQHPKAWGKSALWDTIAAKINAFDIETLVSPEDQRSLRVEFSLAQPSTVKLIHRLGAQATDQEVQRFVHHGRELRTLPRHFTFQLINRSQFRDAYRFSPELKGQDAWQIQDLQKILLEIKEFAGEGVISFALCEASEYPQILNAIQAVQALETFELVIETSGRGWDSSLIQQIAALNFTGLLWILELDSQEEGVYQQLRGEGYAQAQETALALIDAFPGQVYPQSVRTPVTDPGLEAFYKYWKEKAGQVIVQKHNDFSGRRTKEKILDLSPIKREPCWHLKRSLTFWADGRVSPCREDWEDGLRLGKAGELSLSEIWEKGDTLYKEQLSSSYRGICEACDEYYIYHF